MISPEALRESRAQLRPASTVVKTLGTPGAVVITDAYDNRETKIFCCEVCSQAIEAPSIRWNCPLCIDGWNCCAPCYNTGTFSHPHALEREPVTATPELAAQSCMELVLESTRNFKERPLLGSRQTPGAPYAWLQYGVAVSLALDISAGLRATPNAVCALRARCIDTLWVVALLGALLRGLVLAPIPPNSDLEATRGIFEMTKAQVVFADMASRKLMLRAAQAARLELHCVVELSKLPENLGSYFAAEEAPPAQLASMRLCDLIRIGVSNRFCNGSSEVGETLETDSLLNAGVITAFPEDGVRGIIFTSGSTGKPKGIPFSDTKLCPMGRPAPFQPFVNVDYQPFDAGYITQILATMRTGGRRGFASLETLLADFAALRPTLIGATPIFWNFLYNQYQKERAELFAKIPPSSEAMQEVSFTGASLEELDRRWRTCLGNRVFSASSGGAPIAGSVLTWARRVLGVRLSDNYGAREVGAIAQGGFVLSWVELRLLELDDNQGGASPNIVVLPPIEATGEVQVGEICVQTPNMIETYLGAADSGEGPCVEIDGQHFYRTGDVGELEMAVDGSRKITLLDRCSYRVKLSSGEWLLPSRVETCLEAAPWIEHALVMADPGAEFPVTVIVPSAVFHQRDEGAVCEMLRLVRNWCAQAQLRAFEIPQVVHLEATPWTVESGALLPGLKKNRGHLMRMYSEVKLSLYASRDRRSPMDMQLDSSGVFRFSCNELQSVQMLLPPDLLLQPQLSLSELGVNSLVAAQVVARLAALGVDISLGTILSIPLQRLDSLTSSAIHAPGLSVVQDAVWGIADWTSECSLGDLSSAVAAAEASIKHVVSNQAKLDCILLIGCTGFLGPFLLWELLRSYPPGTHVACLVRAKDKAASLDRILSALRRAELDISDSDVLRLVPLVGDADKPLLGLSLQDLALIKAAQPSDLFINAAHVNMVLPYSALRRANALSVQEALVVSLLCGRPTLHFVSSTSAITKDWPDEVLRQRTPECIAALHTGYAQSKAVAEEFLRQAALHHAVDVRVYRPSTISASNAGVANRADFTLLLLAAAVALRKAPRASAMPLAWIPVDFVASAIVRISRLPPFATPAVFHLCGVGPSLGSLLRSVEPLLGITLQNISGEEWCKSAATGLSPTHPAAPLCASFLKLRFHEDRSLADFVEIPTVAARAALKGDWFSIDDAYFRACLIWLLKDGFFDPCNLLEK